MPVRIVNGQIVEDNGAPAPPTPSPSYASGAQPVPGDVQTTSGPVQSSSGFPSPSIDLFGRQVPYWWVMLGSFLLTMILGFPGFLIMLAVLGYSYYRRNQQQGSSLLPSFLSSSSSQSAPPPSSSSANPPNAAGGRVLGVRSIRDYSSNV